MDECIICSTPIDEENAPVLEMGAYGHPKYLCDECAADLDGITLEKDVEKIRASMSRLTKKIDATELSEKTFATITSILDKAASRAKAIEEGSYDFSLDEAEGEEVLEEIPEELLETEEDRELDRKEAEKNKKLDKITNIVCIVMLAIAFGFLAYKLITTFI